MFIVNLTYIKPLEEIEKAIKAHSIYLEEQYVKKNFIASGRKIPRDGGIILSKMDSKDELEKVLEEDPFKKLNIAKYDIIEFVPSKTSKDFGILK